MPARAKFFFLLITVVLAGCAHTPRAAQTVATAATLTGDAAHPGSAQGWVEAKLYFGLGSAEHPEQGVSEAQWRAFLDKEVSPRFPAGLSVLDVYGQWQGKNEAALERLRSKMLLIYMPDDTENRAKIDAIRSAWKQKTGDQSVLLAIVKADISF